MPKSIMFFMPSLAGGGAERTIVNLLKAISNRRYEVTLVLGKERADNMHSSKYISLIPAGVRVIYLPVEARKRNIMHLILSLRRCLKEVKPDVFFSTRIEANVVAIISSFNLNVRVIIRESNFRSATINNPILRFLIGFIYNKADRVIVLSKGVLKDLVEEFGLDKSKASVIYNPIDIEHIRISSVKSKQSKNGSDCVFIGRLDQQKNPNDAIKSFAHFNKINVNAKLRVLGVGPLEGSVKNLVSELGLKESVFFEGFLDNPYEVLSASDFLIMTSDYEGFGHVIVEALVCGAIPIVYNCLSGPSEILNGELSYLLVPVGDYKGISSKLLELSVNEELRNRLLKAGHDRACDFDSTKIVELYIKELF